MNSHIAITKDGHPFVLTEDFSISIDDQNPLFNDKEMFSTPFPMPIEGNKFFFGNIADPFSAARPVSLEHTRMRILVDGMPFRSGLLVTSEDEEITDVLTMNIAEGTHTMQDLIGNMTCQDVPLLEEIQIGEKIGNISVSEDVKFTVKLTYSGKKPPTSTVFNSTDNALTSFSPQALGASYPGICHTVNNTKEKAQPADDKSTENYAKGKTVKRPSVQTSFINVSDPYPDMPYCNARVAYKHYGVDDDGKTSDKVAARDVNWGPNAHYPYWVLEADRPQSGVCFYVLYFLDCLFAHLGVSFDKSELMAVEDMRHLCFFTTHCKYTERPKYPAQSPYFNKASYEANVDDVNTWLESRGCGGSFAFGGNKVKTVNDISYKDKRTGQTKYYEVGSGDVTKIEIISEVTSRTFTADIMNMYATSENFPDESVSSVLEALWGSFGIKFDYDYERKHVKAYFVRNVFRGQEQPIRINGTVFECNKVAEKITGVRVKYGAESSPKDQEKNVKKGVRNYDTDYNYIDYPIERVNAALPYRAIQQTPYQSGAANDMSVYIDRNTGNAYRIKISSTAEQASDDFHPVLFEVGQFKGVEIGDCSELNEDFVQEISSEFVPVPFSDVNYLNEVMGASGTLENDDYLVTLNLNGISPVLSAFVDEDMEHEFTKVKLSQSLGSSRTDHTLDLVLENVESYDPSKTEDGNSPLQSYDWGLAIAIMRGGGTDADVQAYDHNYDGFGNSKWRTVAGDYAMTADSIDMFGNEFDYNGPGTGVGGGERFSLKIRSWKHPSWVDDNGMYWADVEGNPVEVDENNQYWADSTTGKRATDLTPTYRRQKHNAVRASIVNTDVEDSNTHEIEKKIKSRGLFDTFLAEYAYFLLNRRKFRLRMLCSAAQVADIPNHWNSRFRFPNGLTGFINKVSYDISTKEGIGEVEFELFVV